MALGGLWEKTRWHSRNSRCLSCTLAQDSSREEKRSVALALLLVFTPLLGDDNPHESLKHCFLAIRLLLRSNCNTWSARTLTSMPWAACALSPVTKSFRPAYSGLLLLAHAPALTPQLPQGLTTPPYCWAVCGVKAAIGCQRPALLVILATSAFLLLLVP